MWLQALIVVCAYCGYKALDNYSVYAFDVLEMNETEAARFTATFGYIRPFAAILAGLVGDRFGIARTVMAAFGVLAASWAALSALEVSQELRMIVYANLLISIFGVYALRGLYFALLEETRMPVALTGTAVGLISVVGFTPDIFFSPVVGRLLDATPGIGGHQDCYVLLSGVAVIGLVTATVLNYGAGRRSKAVISA